MSDGRPSWDTWGIGLAHAVAERADCTRRAVGAVLMSPDHSIVSTGYNGGPPKGPSCLKGECPRGLASQEEIPGYDSVGKALGAVAQDDWEKISGSGATSYDIGPGACIALHAEQNALLRATWDEMRDSTLYVTCKPCPGCIRMICGTHIDRVVWYIDPEQVGIARIRGGRFIEDAFTRVRSLR